MSNNIPYRIMSDLEYDAQQLWSKFTWQNQGICRWEHCVLIYYNILI